MASITIGSGTPSSYHFFISAQSFALRMNGVPRRSAKCASISWKYVSGGVSAATVAVIIVRETIPNDCHPEPAAAASATRDAAEDGEGSRNAQPRLKPSGIQTQLGKLEIL